MSVRGQIQDHFLAFQTMMCENKLGFHVQGLLGGDPTVPVSLCRVMSVRGQIQDHFLNFYKPVNILVNVSVINGFHICRGCEASF